MREYGCEKGIAPATVTDFAVLPGNGLTATLEGVVLRGGNRQFVAQYAAVSAETQRLADRLAEEGKTPLFFAADDRLLGIVAVADRIKEDSPAAVAELRRMGVRVVMLTGDNARTAAAIGQQVGVDEVTSKLPLVMVPVLSKATVVTPARVSK